MAAVAELQAERNLALGLLAGAVFVGGAFGVDGEPGELPVEDDVDHARDCVGTPGRRGAAGHYVDPLDQR